MAGSADTEAVSRFIFGRLSAAAAVTAVVGAGSSARIYPDKAPQGTDRPFLLFGFQRGRSGRVAGGRARALSDEYLQIGATVDGEDYEAAETLMQAVDASLTADDAEGVIAVGGVSHYVSVVGQERDFRMPETVKGQEFRTSGKVYRIQVFDR
jgi:hypothetical protein